MSQTPAPVAAEALRAQQRAEALSSALPPLLVAAERVAATVAQGVHGRRRVGTGETFWQYRRYEPGDASTMIDWRQSAKTQRVFVRENEWEAAQTAWLWSDASPSMDWRSDRGLPTKRERAELLVMALAVLLARGGERVALLGGGQPPGTNRFALARMAMTLSGPGLGGDGLPSPAPLPRHAMLMLAGDLLSPLPDIHRVVSSFAARGLRGHLLQVLDPAEETLPYDGRVEFAGLEGEEDLLVPRVEAVRAAYRERLEAHRAGLAALARAAGWSYAVHRTDRPPQSALLALYGAVSQQPVG
ncbi:DUF58 domain-containing protein [Arenibaculum pallidiluteum]|uniref:DUF58 domain-containing protein n=1 Tax=Arenibaculum pallidiluteum TaxID=2812559 RepID=UPI001A9690E5|nr:DUF58 domain-containing protein [Arenibaculum pallidiluteum]